MTGGAATLAPPAGTVWIGPAHPFDLHEAYLVFEADLDLPAGSDSTFHVAASGRYRLLVNGAFAGRGPERSWPMAMAVDPRPLPGLPRGRATIAVELYHPGYSHFAHVERAAAGILGWLEAGGEVVLRTTPAAWRVRRDRSWASEVPRVSIYGTGVERRDLRDPAPADWATPRIVQPPAGPVWGGLRSRRTPLLVEEVQALTTPWQTRHGPTPPPTGDAHLDLRAAFAACPPGPVPPAPGPGRTSIWVFDLGASRPCLGTATLTAAAGDRLSVSYAERLRDGEVLLSDPETYCRMRPTDLTTLREGRQTVEGFTPRGGRFVIFRLDSLSDAAPEPAFAVRTLRSPIDTRPLPPLPAPFDAIAALCLRTTLACLQDGFVDSVWREASQWLGDVVAQAFALAAVCDDLRPLRMAVDMAAEGAAGDGILPSVLPGEVPAYVVTDYNFSWVELLAMLVVRPGGAEVVAGHWGTLTRMLARFAQDRGADGLIRSQPGRRLFLDWSAMDRAEPNLTYTLRHLHALNLAAGMADRLRLPGATGWRAEAAAIADRLSAFRSPQGWRESPGGAPACQLALSLLILTGSLTADEAQALADTVVATGLAFPNADPALPVAASPFMHHYVFQALDRLGRGADILAIIARRWGPWAAAGEPGTWENWSIDFPDGSACHGFSAHPLGWILRLLPNG